MIFNWRVSNSTLPKTKGTTMKKFVAPLLIAVALVAAPAFASDTVHTLTWPETSPTVTYGEFLKFDGEIFRVMELSSFCDLNGVTPENCVIGAEINSGDTVSFQT
jgi:hypothetical protein